MNEPKPTITNKGQIALAVAWAKRLIDAEISVINVQYWINVNLGIWISSSDIEEALQNAISFEDAVKPD